MLDKLLFVTYDEQWLDGTSQFNAQVFEVDMSPGSLGALVTESGWVEELSADDQVAHRWEPTT